MPLPAPLSPDLVFTPCRPADLNFASTADLPDMNVAQMHPRAVEAVHLGLDIRHKGYNLFVLGEAGSGRHAIVQQLLDSERKQGEPPADWCYVNNFAAASRPQLLRLPCGRGARLRDDMQRFVGELAPALAAAFASDSYRSRIEALQEEEKQREEMAVRRLGDDAVKAGIVLLRTPQGFSFVPLKAGEETYSQEEFAQLPEARQEELGRSVEEFRERLQKLVNEFPRWRREVQDKIKEASREALRLAVGHLIEDLKPAYADLPAVTGFIDAAMADIIESGESLHEGGKDDEDSEVSFYTGSISVQRYLVNLLVENSPEAGRPVVYEDHPTLPNLLGRVEHMVHMGTLVSNFTLIKAGALHRANGGFLVLDAVKVLSQPYAWEGLKRVLKSGELRIESLSDLIGLSSTLQLEPEPAPLDLKVVLIGERTIYYLLSELDPEFAELFKINADMASEVVRNPENTAQYAGLIASLARREGLRPLAADAVASLIEHSARLASDAERLSTQTQPLNDLMREAEHFAAKAAAPLIGREHIEAALAAHRRRHEHLRQHYLDDTLRGQWLLATSGVHVGQINGLAVVPLGAATFAHPVRITATVRMGEGEVIDIEREVDLGGPIHSKGVLILSAFLAARFGWSMPLSLRASLVFEQSYGGIDGDSASLAELAALLSALSDLPIRQSLAVTGSVNQFGIVQAVGGINEKIEGFFDVCQARGLTGEQGVLIPAANVCHLMLRQDVVAAIKANQFRIWAVTTIDEAMELLTGVPAGEPDAEGEIPEGTVNFQVALQLSELAEMRQSLGGNHRRGGGHTKVVSRKKKAPPLPTPAGKDGES